MRSRAQAIEGEAGSLELRAKAIERSLAQAIEAIPLKPKSKAIAEANTNILAPTTRVVAEGYAGPLKLKAIV